MDYAAYILGWSSGFFTGLTLGALIGHGLTWYYCVKPIFPTGNHFKGIENDQFLQGIVSAIPHLLRKGKHPLNPSGSPDGESNM